MKGHRQVDYLEALLGVVDDSTECEGERDGQQLLLQDSFHLGGRVNIGDGELLET